MAAFITVWKTDNAGNTNDNQIRLGLKNGGTYNFDVDWGDSTSDTITSWDQAEVTHTYSSAGTYTVTITGTIIGWADAWNRNKLLEIQQWGDLKFTNLSNFGDCQLMDVTATDTPDLSGITSLNNFFNGCNYLVNANGSIGNWNVSGITTMQSLFNNCHLFNQNINSWDVSNVTNMYGMFSMCNVFNQPLNNWDVSNVEDFQWMFWSCLNFNQNINDWDVSGANTLSSMFEEAHAFNQPLDKWDLRNVTDISQMFTFQGWWGGEMSFNQDLSDWNVSGITNFNNFMFGTKLSTTNYDKLLNSWAYQPLQTTITNNQMHFGDSQYCDGATARQHIIDTYEFDIYDGGEDPECGAFITVWKTDNTILGSTIYNQIKLPLVDDGTYNFDVDWGDGNSDTITSWNQAEVTHTYSSIGTYTITITGTIKGWRFNQNSEKNKILDIQQWGCLELVNNSPGRYFYGCSNLDVTATDTPNLDGITDCQAFFRNCENLVNANGSISDWNVSGVTNMFEMFWGCYKFNQPLNDWNMSNVENIGYMFRWCRVFNQPLDNWDVSNVTNMYLTFTGCWEFNQNINSWNTSNVMYASFMFSDCYEFNQPLNNWNVSNLENTIGMFYSAVTFNQPLDDWDTSSVTALQYTFYDSHNFDQDLSNWVVTGVTDFRDFLYNAKLSTTNYDLLLNSWAYQDLQTTITNNQMHFGDSEYCYGATARQYIIDTYGFDIIDGGEDPACDLEGLELMVVSVTSPTFEGAEDGQIVLTASGGTLPYQFSIDGGDTWVSSATFSNLKSAMYECGVKDADNNTNFLWVDIEEGKGILPEFQITGDMRIGSCMSDYTFQFYEMCQLITLIECVDGLPLTNGSVVIKREVQEKVPDEYLQHYDNPSCDGNLLNGVYKPSYSNNFYTFVDGIKGDIYDCPFVGECPEVTTYPTIIGETSALFGGEVTDAGGGTVSERGFAYGTSPFPTTGNTKIAVGDGVGSFTYYQTGLTTNLTYYVRAYALNQFCLAYGQNRQFKPQPPPSLAYTIEIQLQSPTYSNAYFSGNVYLRDKVNNQIVKTHYIPHSFKERLIKFMDVEEDRSYTVDFNSVFVYEGSGGSSAVLAQWRYNDLNTSPPENGINIPTKIICSPTASQTLDNFDGSRSYVVNTILGTEMWAGEEPPTVTTSVALVGETEATLGGNVINQGDATVTARGVVWSDTNIPPTASDNVVPMGSGIGIFSQVVGGFTIGITYAVRAYATNMYGTSYGETKYFKPFSQLNQFKISYGASNLLFVSPQMVDWRRHIAITELANDMKIRPEFEVDFNSGGNCQAYFYYRLNNGSWVMLFDEFLTTTKTVTIPVDITKDDILDVRLRIWQTPDGNGATLSAEITDVNIIEGTQTIDIQSPSFWQISLSAI